MRTLLAFSIFILLLLSIHAPCKAQGNSSLTVQGFSWGRWQKPPDAEINWEEPPTSANPPRSEEDQKVIERRYGDKIRSDNLRKVERDAAGSAIRPGELYKYKVKVQNTDSKTIRILYWEYQVSEATDPGNLTRRQFVCSVKLKANERKELIGISASPPTNVVSAKTLGNNSQKPFEEKAIINRIEYADGSAWQRSDWDFPTVKPVPPGDIPGAMRNLDCIGF